MRPVTDSHARAMARLRAKRLRQAGIIASFVAVIALFGTAYWAVQFSSLFVVSQVEVVGIQGLDSDQVRQVAGVVEGTALAQVNISDVAGKLSGLPAVGAVNVERHWPSTIEINITERQPQMVVKWLRETFLADSQGVTFRQVTEAPADLLVVEIEPTKAQILADAYLVNEALSAKTAEKVELISATSIDSIELKLKNGDKVIFGSAEDREVKSQVLDVLLKRNGKTYDVSAPAFPSVR